MFHRTTHPKKTPPQVQNVHDLTRVASPADLLKDTKRQTLLNQIQTFCGLNPDHFDAIGKSLIHNVVNHCQSLPETSNSYYANAIGLVDHALNRTEAALALLRECLLQEPDTEPSEAQKLWIYALFSAAILQGMGKLQSEYQVTLFDAHGQLLRPWRPLLEDMASISQYYSFEFQPENSEAIRKRLNLLVAHILMPAHGFAWIVSDPDVLAIWLALLNEDTQSAGTLGAILIRADAIAIQRYFDEHAPLNAAGHTPPPHGRISTFVDTVPKTLAEKEYALAVEFIKWLMQNLESGKLMINKAPLLSVPGGLLMSSDLYKLFVREHPEYKNWQAAQRAFRSLNLHHEGQHGDVMDQYAVALPNQMHTYNTKNKTSTPISAIDFIHQTSQGGGAAKQLTRTGQWQSHTNTQPLTPTNRSTQRG